MSQTNFDSNFCGSLPIHLINLVQPYGVLVVLDKETGHIIQVSENASRVFSTPAERLVNSRIDDHVGDNVITALKDRLSIPVIDKIPTVWTIDGRSHLTVLHFKEQYILAEIDANNFEESEHDSFIRGYQKIRYAMANIEAAQSVKEVCEIAARELKYISGFDKVMIYRFDEEWNGTVLAEELEEGMESYLGFTFPASDIPQQARLMYLKNAYRFIPTREYEPVKLHPVINPITNSFLDLSDCNLRSVPAVHLEYLKNMQITASMSVRILNEDKLWGLIACHHREARPMDHPMCSMLEMLSGVLSARILSLQNREMHAFDSHLKEHYTHIVETIYKRETLAECLTATDPDILALFNASGVVVTHKGRTHKRGEVPEPDAIEDLLLWLHTQRIKNVFHTDSLHILYDQAIAYAEQGSGLMVIPINGQQDEYVLIFRPEVIRVINWGGNPGERIQFEADGKNYHPRHSFKQWQQEVSNTSLPWKPEELQMAEQLRSFIYEYTTR